MRRRDGGACWRLVRRQRYARFAPDTVARRCRCRRASAQVDTIDEDEVMNLIDDRAPRAITATTAHNAYETNVPRQENPPDGAD